MELDCSPRVADEHAQCLTPGLDPDFHQFLTALVEERTWSQATSHENATLAAPFRSTSKSDLTAVRPEPDAAQQPEIRPSAALQARAWCQAACASSSSLTTSPSKNAYAASIAQLLKNFGKRAPNSSQTKSRQQPQASLATCPQLPEASQPGQNLSRFISSGQSGSAGVTAASHVTSKNIKGSGKHTNAWILKNRRAQQRHRAKERVRPLDKLSCTNNTNC